MGFSFQRAKLMTTLLLYLKSISHSSKRSEFVFWKQLLTHYPTYLHYNGWESFPLTSFQPIRSGLPWSQRTLLLRKNTKNKLQMLTKLNPAELHPSSLLAVKSQRNLNSTSLLLFPDQLLLSLLQATLNWTEALIKRK